MMIADYLDTILNKDKYGIVEYPNIDLYHRPQVQMPDGSVATIMSTSFTDDNGNEVLVPMVTPDGRVVSERQAWANYLADGKHLGIVKGIENAERYADILHRQQEDFYLKNGLLDLPADD